MLDALLPMLESHTLLTASRGLLLGFVASWIGLLFHELGHALAAWLVGVRI